MGIRRLFGVAALTGALALEGCVANRGNAGSAASLITRTSTLPAPTRADFKPTDVDAVLGPYDRLLIDVFGLPELSREVQVDASGHIAVPMAGSIDAGGKTAGEVAALITAGLRRSYVRNPQVAVNVKESQSRLVTIDGEVREPGMYPVVNGMTLARAVATAKGGTEFTDYRKVVLLRTVNGQHLAAVYDLKSIYSGVYVDPTIYPNDVVLVGDNASRRVFRDGLQLVTAIASPLVYVLTR